MTAPTAQPHQLQCLELWGGSGATDQAASVPGIDVYVSSRPYHGDTAGGDVYLVSMCGAGNITRFVLADVAGHGESVSEVATKLRRLMRKYINTPDQSKLTRAINREFQGGLFATAVLATYFAPTDHLIVVNAGHPSPLHYRAGDGSWAVLGPTEVSSREVGISNLPLGIIEPTSYDQFAVKLEVGDIVVMFTDELIEASSPRGELLGVAGLVKIAESLDAADPAGLLRGLLERVDAYREGAESNDDQTVMVLHHNAADPPALAMSEKIRVLGRMLGIGTLDSAH